MTAPAPAAWGRTDNGAEVMGVFHSVEDDQQAGAAQFRQNLPKSAVGGGRGHGDDALMIFAAGHAIEGAAGFEPKGHARLATLVDQLLESRILTASGRHDLFERAARAQRFRDGVDAAEDLSLFHERFVGGPTGAGTVEKETPRFSSALQRFRVVRF